jgi:hypothetical protein
LVTNGSGVLSFAAVGASAGQVIQVLSATDSTQRTTSSTSFVTGSNTLSVTITPSSASNKIFITMTSAGQGSGDIGYYTIFRGATNLGNGNNGMTLDYDAGSNVQGGVAMDFLDSPNTTSATTYQVYMRSTSPVNTFLNKSDVKGSITCFEIKG